MYGTGPEFIYKAVQRISDISTQDTVQKTQNEEGSRIDYKIDWSNLYGELGEGEYQFILGEIRYEFTVDAEGRAELKNKKEPVQAEGITVGNEIENS